MKRLFVIVFALVFLMLSVAIVSADDATSVDPAVAKIQKQRDAIKVQREARDAADVELKALDADYKQKKATLTGDARQDADLDYKIKHAKLNKKRFSSGQCADAISRGLQCSNR